MPTVIIPALPNTDLKLQVENNVEEIFPRYYMMMNDDA